MATKKKPAKRPARRRTTKPTAASGVQQNANGYAAEAAVAPKALTPTERAESADYRLDYVCKERDRVLRQAHDLRDALKALAKVVGRNGYLSLDG